MESLLSRVRELMSVSGEVVLRCKLDLHADTCSFDVHCWVLATYLHTLSVSGFDPLLGSIPTIKVAKIAVAYDCPCTLGTFYFGI